MRAIVKAYALFLISVSVLFAQSVTYEHRVVEEPPNHIHILRADLYDASLDFHVQVADPPPAGEEGQAVLTDPYVLAERGKFLWAINSNPWNNVDGTVGGLSYTEGKAVDNIGWAQTGGIMIFPPTRRGNFWIDTDRLPFIGNVTQPVENALVGIEGFSELIREGIILYEVSDGAREPRTAIGFDRAKRFLFMVVVEGRRPGDSEGMDSRELALFMQGLECWNALNLDGGGSSIMLQRTDSGYERKNRLPPLYPVRPLPLVFGVLSQEPPSGNGGGGGCFIATAAFGSPFEH
ncbi:MAG TPA: phosphodiester glycosidase family protein, partial [bacterium]|nr:phosphodiester glycosidase family protein [bacterium]